MALITKLERGHKERNSIHKEVECTFFIVTDNDGKKYLQLDTYGSKDREVPGKTSQSIQFSPAALKQLHGILQKEFV